MKNEMVLNFDELNKLDQFEQANVLWEIIERMGFKDATMEPNDSGYSIELECEELDAEDFFFVENISWDYDEVDVEMNRELPTALQISYEDFNDYISENGDTDTTEVNHINVCHFLNEEYMTCPESFKIVEII
jgi:hypothetical protein